MSAWRNRACRTVSAGWFGAYYSHAWPPFRPGPSGAGRVPARSSARSTAACTAAPGCSSASRCSRRVHRRAAGAAAAGVPARLRRRRDRGSSRRSSSSDYPDRLAGTRSGRGASGSVASSSRTGFRFERNASAPTFPGAGKSNAEPGRGVVGRSPGTIVVMAHRDNDGSGPGANDNASGTAALIELARAYARAGRRLVRTPAPERTRSSSSRPTAAPSAGSAPPGSRRTRRYADDIAGGDQPRRDRRQRARRASSSPATRRARLPAPSCRRRGRASRSRRVGRLAAPSAVRQLLDLGFPFTLYEQAPFVAHGIPAVTLTTAGDHPPDRAHRHPTGLRADGWDRSGRAARTLLGSLDEGLELAQGTYELRLPRLAARPRLGDRAGPLALLLPFLAPASTSSRAAAGDTSRWRPALRATAAGSASGSWSVGLFELFAAARRVADGAGRADLAAQSGRARLAATSLLALGVLAARSAGSSPASGCIPRRSSRPRRSSPATPPRCSALGVARRCSSSRRTPSRSSSSCPRCTPGSGSRRLRQRACAGAARRARRRASPGRCSCSARLRRPLRARPGRTLVPCGAARRRLRTVHRDAAAGRLARRRGAARRARRSAATRRIPSAPSARRAGRYAGSVRSDGPRNTQAPPAIGCARPQSVGGLDATSSANRGDAAHRRRRAHACLDAPRLAVAGPVHRALHEVEAAPARVAVPEARRGVLGPDRDHVACRRAPEHCARSKALPRELDPRRGDRAHPHFRAWA